MAGANMPIEVIFPKVDMDMESGVLSEWLCTNGDTVTQGQPIFVIETDKSAMEIEAATSGRIAIGPEAAIGTQFPVGQVIAYIYKSDESFDVSTAGGNERHSGALLPAQGMSVCEVPALEVPVREASECNVSQAGAVDGAVRASPAARRIAAEHGIPLSHINGSARRGRIVKADVMARVSAGAAYPAGTAPALALATPAATAAGTAASSLVRVAEQGGVNHTTSGQLTENASAMTAAAKRIPHSQMRRTIASRLTHSVQTIPSYQVVVDCFCESLLQTSRELNNGLASGLVKSNYQGTVSLNVFFIKALGVALGDVAQANCQWSDNATMLFDSVDIGMAVALDGGLITPIIKSVESKSVLELASETRLLVERAKKGNLTKAEYEGGVSTVSNLGMYGIPEFTSIINSPQSSIVSIGAVEQSAVAIDNQLQIKSKCRATFTFDHRVIDGAVGAQVASRFKETVENSLRMFL